MRLTTLALGISLFFVSSLNAQEPVPAHAIEDDIPMPAYVAPVYAPDGGLSAMEAEAATPRADRPLNAASSAMRTPGQVAVTGDSTSPFTIFSPSSVALFHVTDTGRVGIGTTTPGYDIDVVRTGTPTQLRLSTTDSTSFSALRFFEGLTINAHISSQSSGGTGVGGPNTLQIWNSINAPIVLATAGLERMRINGNGNVSIGTAGDGGASLYVRSNTPGYAIAAFASRNYDANVTQNEYMMWSHITGTVASGVTNNGTLYGSRFRSFGAGAGTQHAVIGMRSETGSLGTGVVETAVGASIIVSAATGTVTNGYGVLVADVAGTNDYAFYQAAADDSNYFGGNVSIGVANIAATAKLQVHDTAHTPRVLLTGTEFYQSTNTSADGVGLYLGMNRSGNRQLWIGDSASATAPFLRIAPQPGATVIDAVTRDGTAAATLTVGTTGTVAIATGTGLVGIGTATPNPAYKLHVVGNAHFDGSVTGTNIRATYQDVAEWVPSTTDLEPGTVVVLNVARNNEVMASHSAYDTRVAGVVSAQPGLSLGIEGDGKEQIATYGRVKVKVDARKAPVGVGDLLVTGEIPGTAMRSVPMDINGRSFHQPGTIIGKALEPLEGGIGEILVLLSMQ
jgi:hypothetical protein